MKVMGFAEAEQKNLWNIVAAILHLGNVTFSEKGNYAQIVDQAGN